MGEQKNTVIINGKTYDAVSGNLVNSAAASNQLVSDFIKTPRPQPSQLNPPRRRSAHHLAHHKPQKSITLKRSLAQVKPGFAKAKSLPLSNNHIITAAADKVLLSSGNRYQHARSVTKSSAISRFSFNDEPSVVKQHLPLSVKPAPQEAVEHHQPMPKADFNTASPGEALFSAALNKAESHKQVPLKLSNRKHRLAKKLGVSAKAANIVTIVFVTLTIAGFAAYQNSSRISMHAAASQSGLAGASLPSFQPSGFSLSRQVVSSPGQIILSYRSNSDDRAFTITQVSSNWNSQTLADSFLTGKQVQRQDQANGKIIFFYGASNATWVDGGIWYRIEGNSSLSSDQLLKIANSF